MAATCGGAGEPRRDERGGATVLFLAALGVALCVAAAVMLVGSYAYAAHRGRGAADLAALAGATAHSHGDKACAKAARIAAANGARLTDCQVTGDGVEHVVKVSVERRVKMSPGRLPKTVYAQAWAGRMQE